MIELKNVSKQFNGKYVLKNINLKLRRYGIVCIAGPSGCGKTTLLNILSSLINFEGDVIFEGRNYRAMSENDRDNLRNNKIGFIFQDYKLFENETVKTNLLLALDIKCEDKQKTKERKVLDLLKIVGLTRREDTTVSSLSGGEKQRLALARAISNSPKIILADEPTGNLDEQNSVAVMTLLQKIAKKSLVILVSHDLKLASLYADEVIHLKDGVIEHISYNHHNKHIDPIPLVHINPKDGKSVLPLSFCFKHAFRIISKRKWRTLFILLTTSLGLFGVGLGTMLTDTISTNLYKSYSSIIDTNKVIVEKKKSEQVVSNKVNALSLEEVNEIRNEYKKDIKDIGVYYWNDFEKMFTSYDFYLEGSGNKTLSSFTLKAINEFDLLENIYNPYPEMPSHLEIDEVVLSLDISTVNEICYQLHIPKTVKSLSEHLTKNEVIIDVDIENTNWQYDVSFSFKLKAFTLSREIIFYHSNRHWNEYIFENLCHLSQSDIISGNSKNPWDLKKSYYLEFTNSVEPFLKDIRFNHKYQYIVGEILDDKYYPLIYKDTPTYKCNRVCLLTKENRDEVESYISPFIKDFSSNISSVIFGSQCSYAIYPESLMMGFSRETYLSNSIEKIEEMIDLTTYLKYEESMNMVVPEDIVEGHFAKPSASSLSFNSEYNLIGGNYPSSLEEIVISKTVMEKLEIKEAINSVIYFAFPIKEELLPSGYLLRKYKYVPLVVSGVSDSEKLELSHDENWTISFFQIMLGVSSFDLSIDSMALSTSGNVEEVISKIEKAFPSFKASSPIQQVKSSVDNICKYIEMILNILSVSSVIIAAILLSLCNHLHYLEIKKDIGLVRCLGIGKHQSSKLIYSHTILMVILSMIFAIFELLMTCLILSKTFGTVLSIDAQVIFNPLSIVYMLAVSLGISLFSSIIIKRRVINLNPLDCLR